MFQFANKSVLLLLAIIPVLLIGYYWYMRNFRKRFNSFMNPDLMVYLAPWYSAKRPAIKFILLLFVLSLLIASLARPQFGSKLKEVKREGIEIIIALDVSKSMMANDMEPNRLEQAKQAIHSLVSKMKNDKIGLIIFAGDAYTQLPVTADYASARMFLSTIGPDIVTRQGTAIGKAIELGMRSFTQSEESSKVIIVVSDGENHEGDAIETAKAAREKGILVYTIGMGSPRGSLIPLSNASGFVKDNNGNPVTSRMNPEMLASIAQAGGGKFFTSGSSSLELLNLYKELDKLNKTEIESQVYSEYDDQYTYFVALALLILLVEMLIRERKNKWLSNLKLFAEK